MGQDSQQVLGDEIGRIVSEAGVTPEQAKYLRTGFIEMIQKNTMVVSTIIEFPKLEEPDPAVNLARMQKAAVMGVTQIAKTILSEGVFKMDSKETDDKIEYEVAIHLIRNSGS